MQKINCPKCGRETPSDGACPECEPAAVNGPAEKRWVKPPPPPELAGRVFEPVPPEMREEFLRTFNEEEFLAELDEVLKTGGVQIDDLIEELERRLDGSA